MALQNSISLLWLGFLILPLLACKNELPTQKPFRIAEPTMTQDSTLSKELLYYNFSKADSIYILPSELNEISGLCWYPGDSSLLSINDEKGIIFRLDSDTGQLLEKRDFAGDGDFEGITFLKDTAYIITSKGDLYHYSFSGGSGQKKINTRLKGRNDVEGLCAYPERNSLLIACKGQAELDSKNRIKNSKAVYRFDLGAGALIQEPFMLIRDESLEKWIDTSAVFQTESSYSLKTLKSRARKFSPSGIAIQPMSKDIYILSSQGKLLCIFEKSGKLKHIEFLNASHSQPEGICFDPLNRLYISNEAKGLRARLFVFQPIRG